MQRNNNYNNNYNDYWKNVKTTSCQRCDGTGHQKIMGEEICPKCAGLGRDKNSDLWSELCKGCGGRGMISYCRRDIRPCPSCNGNGYINY